MKIFWPTSFSCGLIHTHHPTHCTQFIYWNCRRCREPWRHCYISVHRSVKRREEPSARSSHQRCSVKKVFLSILQNSQENACARACLWIKLLALGLQKETCKIYKNTYFYRTPLDDCFSSADKVLPFMRQALAKMNSPPQVINTLQKENWRWDICWTNIYHAWRYTNILWKAKLNDFPEWN